MLFLAHFHTLKTVVAVVIAVIVCVLYVVCVTWKFIFRVKLQMLSLKS